MEILYTLGETLLKYGYTLAEIITAEMPSILCTALGVPSGTAWIFFFITPTVILIFLTYCIIRWLASIG